ncbi:MAG: transporter substrate-binding domain-containing protein, partial [Fretibacterium sp.]|nr:transporter substrate-binding domain-containing protein [Fretibacterium sp.]
ELNGKRIGVQTGGTFDAIVSARLPDVKFSYFNSYPDMAAALEAGRIDCFPGDEPVLRMMAAENDRLAVLNEYMDTFEFGFVLPKNKAGEKLREELDAYIASIQESGELKEIMDKWTGTGEGEKTLPDYRAFPAPRGTLSLATEGGYPPMNYFHEGEVVGLEIDLTARFCAAYGYGLKVVPMNFDAILTALQSGKYDFAAAGFTITEERKESAYFSRPYYSGGTVMAVLKEADAAAAPHEGTFLNSI